MRVFRIIVMMCVVGCSSPQTRIALSDGGMDDAATTPDGDGGTSDDAAVDAEPTDLVSMCGAVPVTTDDWERCYHRRWCEILVNCSEVSRYKDVDQCLALSDAAYGGSLSFQTFERERAVTSGSATLDTTAFTQCLVETSSQKCNTAAHPPSCRLRYVGTIPDQHICFDDIECASPGATCEQPATCKESCCAGTCTPKPKLGDPCTDIIDGCEPGIVCNSKGTCAAGDLGASCVQDYDCANNGWCNHGACAAALKEGDRCGESTSCADDTQCVGLIRPAAPPTCRRVTHEGDTCDWFCMGNFVCDLPSGTGFGTCKPLALHGQSCGNVPCLGIDQLCINGVCTDRATEGQTCIDGQCQPGLFCSSQLGAVNPVCTAPLADGQSSCNRHSQCESHVCGGDASASGSCQALQAACQ